MPTPACLGQPIAGRRWTWCRLDFGHRPPQVRFKRRRGTRRTAAITFTPWKTLLNRLYTRHCELTIRNLHKHWPYHAIVAPPTCSHILERRKRREQKYNVCPDLPRRYQSGLTDRHNNVQLARPVPTLVGTLPPKKNRCTSARAVGLTVQVSSSPVILPMPYGMWHTRQIDKQRA